MFKLLTILPVFIAKFIGILTKILIKHLALSLLVFLLILGLSGYKIYDLNTTLKAQLQSSQGQTRNIQDQLTKALKDYEKLKNEDQVKKNKQLEETIKNIEETYKKAVSTFETLQDFKNQTNKKWDNFDKDFALSLNQLSQRNYASASATLDTLAKNIQVEKDKLATPPPQAADSSSASAPTTSTPPGSGYQKINVQTSSGTFTVDIIAADLSSTKVVVDSASDSDCANNCPVLPLATYTSRSGAYAGINGNFFCPATYPSCAGKTNSFDLLVMNKNKHYFNSDNNVYSTNPAAIFSAGSARFVGQALEWGRDTGVDAVISNYPMLVQGGNVVFGGSGDPKFGGKGPRSFIANKGGKVYIGYVYSANMSDSANVMKALGMENALNLDEGGSSALWLGGRYLIGPGRDIPTAVLFVNR